MINFHDFWVTFPTLWYIIVIANTYMTIERHFLSDVMIYGVLFFRVFHEDARGPLMRYLITTPFR